MTPGPASTSFAISADDWFGVTQLHARYAQAADQGDWDTWCSLFTEDCRYRLVPRENHDRGLPLATLDFESRGMLKDRAYAIRETLFHDPYRQRHVFGPMLVTAASADALEGESAYAVFRTKLDGASEVFNVGRVVDRIVRTPEGWRFAARSFIYDSEWIPNSLIYPL
jgi:salicylate 5-hydroxylase small subunit